MESYRVLLIEDDPDAVELLEMLLEDIDGRLFDVCAIEGTAAADDLLSRQAYDLMIADNRLALDDKYGTGSAFFAELIQRGDRTPKILLSGAEPHLLHASTQQYINEGTISFLHKQALNAKILESVIESVLAGLVPGEPAKLHSFSRPVVPFGNFAESAQDMIQKLQDKFGFGLAMMTRVQGNDWIVLHAVDRSYGVSSGDVLNWEESFCSRLVAGKGPAFTDDADSVPAYKAAPVREKLQIKSYLGIPICRADGSLFGTLCAIDPEKTAAPIQDELPEIMNDCRYLATILEDELRMEAMLREKKLAELDAKTDGLTGLYNRRGWDMFLLAEEDRCRRYGHVGAVILIDLDGLKTVNDRDGHEAGDRLIQAAAEALSDATRASDVVARLGGDEFGVLAVETSLESAQELCGRLRAQMQKAGVSASIGLAFRDPQSSFEDAARLADERMYEDKRGRKAGRGA